MGTVHVLFTACLRREGRRAMLLGTMTMGARVLVLAASVAVGATVVRNVTEALEHAVGDRAVTQSAAAPLPRLYSTR